MDQVDSAPFNRGALLNVGFLEARRLDNFTCFVFHDVDMVPETDTRLYRCRDSDQVRMRRHFDFCKGHHNLKLLRQ